MKEIILSLIKNYQKFNPQKTINCRFYPSCSQFTYEAVSKYGTIKGLLMGLGRLLRCHPFFKGGHDPVK